MSRQRVRLPRTRMNILLARALRRLKSMSMLEQFQHNVVIGHWTQDEADQAKAYWLAHHPETATPDEADRTNLAMPESGTPVEADAVCDPVDG